MSFSHPKCRAFSNYAVNAALLAGCCGLVALIILSVCMAVKP